MRRLCIILLSVFLACTQQSVHADDVMPIIAYMGVPNDKSTDQNFKDFHDCGFNVSLYGYASLQQFVTACSIAQKYNVRILGHCPETHNKPEYAASILKFNKGFYGYVLQDEPSADDIRRLQKEMQRLNTIDNTHCFYINLLPYYGSWILNHTKTNSYAEYLDVAGKTLCQQVSFDYYPVVKDGLREGWYYNLEMIRDLCLKTSKPMWGFVLSVPHYEYPQPTMGSLRLQVYSNLAYGAQAIQYFTYWTPVPEKLNDFHNGPITQDGRKTNTYWLVKKMNKELAAIAPLFYGAKVTAVNHIGVIPEGTTKLKGTPENIRRIITKGKGGSIVSQFEKSGHKYMAIVNKDYQDSLNLHIEKRNSTPMKVNTDLSLQEMASDYKIPAGGIIIFRLK